jgi:hypothetical protein
MHEFAVIETDDGLTIVEIPAGETADSVAAERGAFVADPGPYHKYEDAWDAMQAIPARGEEEQRGPTGE